MVVSIMFAVGVSVLVGIGLREIFKSLNPNQIGGYRACKGGWWEAHLNNCAQGLLKIPQQPVNTYTNLIYLAGGIFLAFFLVTNSAYVLALSCLYLCVGSALYHATSTRWAGSLDVSGIYVVFTALTVHSANYFVRLQDSWLALIMFVLAAVLGYCLRYKYKGLMQLKIAIFLVLIYIPAIISIIKNEIPSAHSYIYISAIFFVLGFVCWSLDKAGKFPFKRWGHGFWHIFTAGGIGTIFYANYLMQVN